MHLHHIFNNFRLFILVISMVHRFKWTYCSSCYQ